MSDGAGDNVVYWPRVKEILDGIMERWKDRWGREPLPGIHAFYWSTRQELVDSVLSGGPHGCLNVRRDIGLDTDRQQRG